MSEPPEPELETLAEEEYVALARLVIQEEIDDDEIEEIVKADISLFRMETVMEGSLNAEKDTPINFNHALRKLEVHQFTTGDQEIMTNLQNQRGIEY